MARQSFVRTALPNGYTADRRSLRLSVLLSPRLNPESDPQRLDSFPEWLDWPKTLRQAQFTVTCNGASVTVAGDGSGSANVVDGRLGVADSVTWGALFTPALFVRPYQFQDLSGHSVRSYDASAVADLVQGLYTELAGGTEDNLPPIRNFGDSRQWARLISAIETLHAPGEILPKATSSPSAPVSPVAALTPFNAFHTPLAAPLPLVPKQRRDDKRIQATWQEYNRPPMPDAKDVAPQLDFHQIVSAMGSYPKLMRLLGLVVDLLLDPKAFPPGADTALSVVVSFPSGVLSTPSGGDASPVTRTLLSTTAFEAASDPAAVYPVRGRLLDLDPSRFTLLQMDVDGAGLKLMNFARTLFRRGDIQGSVHPVTRQEDTAGVPSLRTAGLMLVQKDRSKWLAARFNANKDRS